MAVAPAENGRDSLMERGGPEEASRLLDEHLSGGIGSILRVHTDLLATNAARVRKCIGPRRFFWAVVKADAYGLGVLPVARTLLEAEADGLAVARIEEYEALRAAGFRCPVLILGPLPKRYPDDPQLHLTATTQTDLVRLASDGTAVPVHLKVDTGMGRLGLPPNPETWLAAAETLGARWQGLWTHYSHSDVPGHPTITRQQELFAGVLDKLGTRTDSLSHIHMANSGGLACLQEFESAVRIGLYLYGSYPWETRVEVDPPATCVEWLTRLVSVRSLPAGHGISYRSLDVTEARTNVCVIPVGYADGLPGKALPAARVLAAGRRLPLRGRITMDLTVVELGSDGSNAEGDPAWLLGPPDHPKAVSVDELAAATDRIPYEVLTAIGPRVVRVVK